MGRKPAAWFLVLTVVLVLVSPQACRKPSRNVLAPEYGRGSQEFDQRLNAAKNKQEYDSFLKERETWLNGLVLKYGSQRLTVEDSIALARAYCDLQRFDKAIALLEPLSPKSEDPELFKAFVNAYMGAKRSGDAALLLGRARTVVKDLKGLAHLYLLVGLSQQKIADAIPLLETALRYPLPSQWDRYVPVAMNVILTYGGLSSEQSRVFLKGLKETYRGVPTILTAVEGKERLLNFIGKRAPELSSSGRWINSRRGVKLSSFRGKYLLLEFFAPWCSHCRASIPLVEGLRKEFSPKGLAVLGVTLFNGSFFDGEVKIEKVGRQKEFALIEAFAKKKGMDFPILVTSGKRVYEDFAVQGIPHFVLLSPEGKVLRFGIGEDKEFFSYCQTLLRSGKR